MNSLSKFLLNEWGYDYGDCIQVQRKLYQTNVESQDDGGFLVTINVAGIPPADINMEVTDSVLTIKSKEDSKSKLEMSYKLTDKLDGSKIKAEIKHGLLTINIPPKESVKSTTIPIKLLE